MERERHVNRLARKQRNTLVACLFAELPIGKQIHSIWSAAHWKPPERTYMYVYIVTHADFPPMRNKSNVAKAAILRRVEAINVLAKC